MSTVNLTDNAECVEHLFDLLFVLLGGLISYIAATIVNRSSEINKTKNAARTLNHKILQSFNSIHQIKKAIREETKGEVKPPDPTLWSKIRPLLGIQHQNRELTTPEIAILDDDKLRDLHQEILELFAVERMLTEATIKYNEMKISSIHILANLTDFDKSGQAFGTLTIDSKKDKIAYATVLQINDLAHSLVRLSNDAALQAKGVRTRMNDAFLKFGRRWGVTLKIETVE